MNKINNLSIFFPFWNEERNIENVVKSAIPVAERVAQNWEIIIVDDGSSDKTLEIANRLAARNPNVRVVSNNVNRGYGAALKTGFENSKYDLVVFNDGDNQFDFSQVDRLLGKINESDIVIGFRKKRLDNRFRHLLMNLLKIWDFVLFGLYFRDIDCGFKLFRKDALRKIMPLYSEGAIITTEILAKAKKNNLKIAEVEVSHFPRKFGDQSGGNLRVIFRAVKESLALFVELHHGRT